MLADQITRAERAIRDPDTSPDEIERAGELVQLAVRQLAAGPRQFRRDVVGRLDGAAARATRANLVAALSLEALVHPQRKFPDWRIVGPPAPESLLEHYRRAERRTGVPWNYLAAIHLVETRMGRIRGTSSAGAQGPMQFIPSTWEIYGEGGNVRDAGDAILAAGRLLADHGAPGDMAQALWHYNPSRSYVRSVSAYARVMERSPRAYHGYWSWRVFFAHRDGTFVLPEGYPGERPVRLERKP